MLQEKIHHFAFENSNIVIERIIQIFENKFFNG